MQVLYFEEVCKLLIEQKERNEFCDVFFFLGYLYIFIGRGRVLLWCVGKISLVKDCIRVIKV